MKTKKKLKEKKKKTKKKKRKKMKKKKKKTKTKKKKKIKRCAKHYVAASLAGVSPPPPLPFTPLPLLPPLSSLLPSSFAFSFCFISFPESAAENRGKREEKRK